MLVRVGFMQSTHYTLAVYVYPHTQVCIFERTKARDQCCFIPGAHGYCLDSFQLTRCHPSADGLDNQ
jgi:hypothetical protein